MYFSSTLNLPRRAETGGSIKSHASANFDCKFKKVFQRFSSISSFSPFSRVQHWSRGFATGPYWFTSFVVTDHLGLVGHLIENHIGKLVFKVTSFF